MSRPGYKAAPKQHNVHVTYKSGRKEKLIVATKDLIATRNTLAALPTVEKYWSYPNV